MSNVLIGSPILSDVSESYTPSFSGGSWSASLPLANLQDRRFSKVARSSSDAIADTKFVADLGRAVIARIVAIPKTNLTLDAKWRVRAFTADPVLDTLGVDEAGWSAVNSPGVTVDLAYDSYGIPLDFIEDNSGASIEHYTRNITFTGNATKVIAFRIKKGTSSAAAGSSVRLRDTTAGADRLNTTITWSGTTPSIAFSTGSLISQTDVGNGVYRIVCLTSSVTAANTNQLQVLPALTAGEQGNLFFGDALAWDAAVDCLSYDSGRVLALDCAKRVNRVSVSQDLSDSSWSLQLAGVMTPGQTDPWGGTDGFLVSDPSAATDGGVQSTVSFLGDGTKIVSLYVKKGTAASHSIGVYDNTAGAWRHLIKNTWTAAGAPSLTTVTGSGTLGTPEFIGYGWYRINFTVESVLFANTHLLILYGAETGNTPTGDTYYTGAQAQDSSTLAAYARTPAVTADDLAEQNVAVVVFPPATMTASRYWRIDFTDTANPDNYVELSRLFICDGYQPLYNMLIGAMVGWSDDASTKTRTDGGSAFYNVRPRFRVLSYSLSGLPDSEVFPRSFDLQRRAGISGQVFVVFDPSDTTHMHRRAFTAVKKQLTPIEAMEGLRFGAQDTWEEEL